MQRDNLGVMHALSLVFLVAVVGTGLNNASAQNTTNAPEVISGQAASPGYTPPPLRQPVTPFQPNAVNGVPQITPSQLPIDTVGPMPEPDEEAQAQKQQQMQQVIDSVGKMIGGGESSSGRSETAGGGGSEESRPSSGFSSAVSYNPGSKFEGGHEMKSINGCDQDKGRFQYIFGHAGAKCKPAQDGNLKINARLGDFLNDNLNRCVAEAAGKDSVKDGKLFHAGVMGDARHQQTRSLHNVGLAIDVNAIEANGRTYNYKSPGDQKFFDAFRVCWGKAANKAAGNCLTNGRRGNPPASVGKEDSDHQNHLHLSLPYCRDEAKRRGLNLALFSLVAAFFNLAHAERPPASFERRQIKLPGAARAEVLIKDQHGEPVGDDHRFRITARCDRKSPPRVLVEDLEGCEYASFEYLNEPDLIELRYRVSILRDGRLFCGSMTTRTFKSGCPR